MADPQIHGIPSTPVQGLTSSAGNLPAASQPGETFANLLTQQLAASGTPDGASAAGSAPGTSASASAITPLLAEAWVTFILQSLPVPGLADGGQENANLPGASLSGMGSSPLGASNGADALMQLLAQMSSQVELGSPSVGQAAAFASPLANLASQAGVQSGIDAAIQSASTKYGVPASLIRGVIEQESGGNPGAVSSAGALGLMQLMPDTANALGVQNPLDPTENIDGGTRYLATLMQQFNGSVPLALAAYNAGPNAVLTHGGIPPYPETQNYVRSVLAKAQNFSAAV